ncbi:MAG: hypothetical protein WB767_08050 [Nocardioides sp.]
MNQTPTLELFVESLDWCDPGRWNQRPSGRPCGETESSGAGPLDTICGHVAVLALNYAQVLESVVAKSSFTLDVAAPSILAAMHSPVVLGDDSCFRVEDVRHADEAAMKVVDRDVDQWLRQSCDQPPHQSKPRLARRPTFIDRERNCVPGQGCSVDRVAVAHVLREQPDADQSGRSCHVDRLDRRPQISAASDLVEEGTLNRGDRQPGHRVALDSVQVPTKDADLRGRRQVSPRATDDQFDRQIVAPSHSPAVEVGRTAPTQGRPSADATTGRIGWQACGRLDDALLDVPRPISWNVDTARNPLEGRTVRDPPRGR